MIDPARRLLGRRSVLAALVLALTGCGGGEQVVDQATGKRFERMKGTSGKPGSPQDPKAK